MLLSDLACASLFLRNILFYYAVFAGTTGVFTFLVCSHSHSVFNCVLPNFESDKKIIFSALYCMPESATMS